MTNKRQNVEFDWNNLPEPPACKFCNRTVLAGVCCQAAFDNVRAKKLATLNAINSDGSLIQLTLCNWIAKKAYATTDGAAAYLCDPDTGKCEGTDGMEGIILTLSRNSLRRLRNLYKKEKGFLL